MKIFNLQLGFLSPLSIDSKEFGHTALNRIRDVLPGALPDRYGNSEPLGNRFKDGGIDGAVEYWRHPFLWKASNPAVVGDFRFGKKLRHSSHHLDLCASDWAILDCLRYFRELSLLFEVDISYLHVFSQEELSLRDRYPRIYPFRRGLLTTDLRVGIPDLTAAMVFGPPYVELFSRDVIFSCPVHSVQEIGRERIELDLIGDPTQLLFDFREFDERRHVIKSRLGTEAFIGAEQGVPLVPRFSFS